MDRIAWWMGRVVGIWMAEAGILLEEAPYIAAFVIASEADALPREVFEFEEKVPGYA